MKNALPGAQKIVVTSLEGIAAQFGWQELSTKMDVAGKVNRVLDIGFCESMQFHASPCKHVISDYESLL